jgi:hypothetical protein
MELILNKDKDKLFRDMFYDLLDSYQIIVNKEYQFVYDDMFEHIMHDINLLTESQLKVNKIKDITNYKTYIFKSALYRHLVSSKGEKLKHPEKFPELKRILRIRKLEKLEKK